MDFEIVIIDDQPAEIVSEGVMGPPGEVAGEAAIRAIAANQDTVQIYDFDAIVAANLGV